MSASPLGTPEPWNLVAQGYVAENLAPHEEFAAEALRLVPAQGEVLDVATGPGTLALLAARTARKVVAADFAPAMLAELEGRTRALGVANVEAQVADGQALPFPDGTFDAAYSLFGVIFFPDRARGLAELRRVLRPGARALVTSWPPLERVPMMAALFGAMKAELPDAGGGGLPPVMGTQDEVRAELAQAGFADVEVHEHTVSPRTVTAAELWRIFSRGGAPVVLMRRKMGEEAFADLSRRITARLEQTLGKAPRELRLTALLGVGRR